MAVDLQVASGTEGVLSSGRRAVRHADAKHLLKLKMKRESMKIERYEVRERP